MRSGSVSGPGRSRIQRFGGLFVRVLLSIVTAYAVFLVLAMYLAKDNPRQPHLSRMLGQSGMLSKNTRQSDGVPWPWFPGMRTRSASRNIFNGVTVWTAREEVSSDNDQILDYYRRQMGARGWEDFTESYYGIEPGLPGCSGLSSGDDEAFSARYQDVISSRLALRRGDRSLYVTVAAGSKSWRRVVSLVAAETSSMAEIGEDFIRKVSGERMHDEMKPLMEMADSQGGEEYKSKIFSSGKLPVEFHNDLTKKLAGDGWRVMLPPDSSGDPKGIYASLLIREQDVGVLLVRSGDDLNGSVAMFTATGTREQQPARERASH